MSFQIKFSTITISHKQIIEERKTMKTQIVLLTERDKVGVDSEVGSTRHA